MNRAFFLLLAASAAHAAPLTTEAERSGFRRTGGYDEVERLCAAFEREHPGRVRCARFGTTPEGRPMLALIASADGVLDPDAARARRRPVVLAQAAIHAGEIEGKEAILVVLRELLAGRLAPGALARVTAVLVPVLNVDGHERRARNHRPNQRGPEETGFRATARNLNLNRDHVKADAPEMRALLALLNDWDPVVVVDLHTTDGARFEHDISVQVSPEAPRGDALDAPARALSAAVQARLGALGHLPLAFYPSFRVEDDPSSGFDLEEAPPRFSNCYAAARNRLGVLVETHSWKSYRERFAAARDTLAAVLERAAVDAAGWRAAADAADAAASRLGGSEVTLLHEPVGPPRTIEFRGYAYRVTTSDLTGGRWIVYDERRPQIWRGPRYDRHQPKLVVRAPRAGYLVAPAWAQVVAPVLALHGVRHETLPARAGVAVEAYAIDELTRAEPFEGRAPVKLRGAWRPARRDLAAGTLFVPIDQPAARLVLHLLEPSAPDSLAAWGSFNAVFEEKEYLEAYVLEEEARRMLARDPSLRRDFDRLVREGASPERRLRFFRERHPSFETSTRSLPVLKVDMLPRRGEGSR
jgi:hypothetical protein